MPLQNSPAISVRITLRLHQTLVGLFARKRDASVLAVDMEELLDLEVSKTLAVLERVATPQVVQEVSKTQAMVDTMEDLPPVNVPVSVPQST